ncbi:MAG TPA: MFS transporter [Candidatus Dormibacteraeota bacterium]
MNWRRNLAALWLAEFTAILGFSFAFPFLPLFLHRELHIPNGSELSFWTGISAGVTGFSLALTAPIWGRLADRYGRKPMLVRAMVGGAVSVGLMGLSQSALQLTLLRGLQGASSGTVAAATALVATGTPPAHMAWSLGILNSAISLGNASGPAIGSLAAGAIGLRAIFFAGGAMLLLATVPVLLLVRESPLRMSRAQAPPLLQTLNQSRPGTVRAIAALVGAQALLQTTYAASQQLVVLRLLQLNPGGASGLTGLTFAGAGIATAVAGVSYSRAVRRSSYRVVTLAAAVVATLAIVAISLAGTEALLIGFFVLASFMSGVLIPAFGAMTGLESPRVVQATVFGFASSGISVGFGLGPLVGGLVAAAAGIRTALLVSAGISAALVIVLAVAVREPGPPVSPVRVVPEAQ